MDIGEIIDDIKNNKIKNEELLEEYSNKTIKLNKASNISPKINNCAKNLLSIVNAYKEIKFNEREFFLIDMNNSIIGNEGIKITKIIDSFDNKILSKIGKAAKCLKYAGMVFAAVGIIGELFAIVIGDKDPMKEELENINKKLDIIVNEIQISTDKIINCIQEESLKTQLNTIKVPIDNLLSEIYKYSKNDLINVLNENTLDRFISKVRDCFDKISNIISNLDKNNQYGFINQYIETIYNKKNIRNLNILETLLELDIFYKEILIYCESILLNVGKIIVKNEKLNNEQLNDLMADYNSNLKLLISFKFYDFIYNKKFIEIKNDCINNLYNEYKSKRLKVGDNIFIKSLENQKYLSVGYRDDLFFEADNKCIWETFIIESLDNSHQIGDMINFGDKINLRPLKDSASNKFGTYNNILKISDDFYGIMGQDGITAATYHWNKNGKPNTVNYLQIINDNNEDTNEFIMTNSIVKIILNFDFPFYKSMNFYLLSKNKSVNIFYKIPKSKFLISL